MPGLLDDFAGGLLLGRPKKLPPEVDAGGRMLPGRFPGQIADPEALARSLHHDIPTPGGPNRFTDAPPGAKIQGRLPEGLPMTGPPVPVAGGPSSVGAGGGPSLLDPNSIAGAQPTLPRPPQFAQAPQFPQTGPMPPTRPPMTPGGNPPTPAPASPQLTPGGNPSLTPPPNPIIPPKIGPPPAIAAPPPITPTPTPIAPAAPTATPAVAGAGGAAGGAAAGLGGVFSALGQIAKGMSGKAAPAPPPAKAPTIQPMSQDPRSASRAQGAQQAMAGILGGPSLLDPRRRGMG